MIWIYKCMCEICICTTNYRNSCVEWWLMHGPKDQWMWTCDPSASMYTIPFRICATNTLFVALHSTYHRIFYRSKDFHVSTFWERKIIDRCPLHEALSLQVIALEEDVGTSCVVCECTCDLPRLMLLWRRASYLQKMIKNVDKWLSLQQFGV